MSDTSVFTPESAFAAPTGAATSAFDVTQVDRNLRQMSAVEQSWRLPALPDAVRLDLASMPGANEDSLLDMLTGLDSDLNDADDEPEQQLILPGAPAIEQTGLQQAQIILAGISNNPPPEVASDDAVRLFKRQAIEKGYLDQDAAKIDSTWSPELNRIRGEMAWDEYNASLRGNRVGAVPIGDSEHGVMKLLNDFTSPSGLLAAATELDFLPDFGAIRQEFSTWGDKWREVGKSDNPWDFAGNLIDALTGPIDDVIFPIINTGLLFTGVGAIANSARVGWQGARLAQAGGLFSRLYGSGRIGQAILGGARLGANLDDLGRASWLATRLQRGGDVATALGRGMEAWRGFTPTRAVKSAVQQGMRLGFANELESRFGGYQGGTGSFADIGPIQDAQGFLERASHSPLAAPFEVLLAPYNVFSPGTFIGKAGVVSRTGAGAFKALGTTGGRAALGATAGVVGGVVAGEDAGDIAKGAAFGAAGGAALPLVGKGLQNRAVASAVKGGIAGGVAGVWLGEDPEDVALGALAGAGIFSVTDTVRDRMFNQLGVRGWNRAIRGLGGAMVRSSFVPLADDQHVSLAFDRGMRWRLRDDQDGLNNWVDDVNRRGVRFALGRTQGGGEELAAATIGYIYTSAAIDWIATAQAGVVKGKGWRNNYHQARNKIINQLRTFDTEGGVTDGMLDDLATAMAWTERGGNPAQVYKRKADILRELKSDPDRALELANGHNMRASETVRQLLNPTNFPKFDPEAQLGEALPRFGPERVSQSLGERFSQESIEGRGWIMQKYMDGILDSFGRFPEFTAATDSIRQARMAGLFDGAKLMPYKSRFGTERSVYRPAKDLEPEDAVAVSKAVTDRLLKVDKKALGNLKVTPLAPSHGAGTVTVALRDTLVKHELEELAERVRDTRDVHEHLARLGAPGLWRQKTSKLLGVEETAQLSDLTDAQVKVVLDQIDTSLGSKKATGYLLGWARRNNKSLAQLEQAVAEAADDIANDAALWKAAGFEELVYNEQGKALYGLEALHGRLDELNEKIPFTASQIDSEDLVRYLRETGNEAGADEVANLVAGLETDGYKLVHGVEFLMPEDLAHGPIFADVTRRHMNAATLGNAFKGKLPVEARLLEDRRHRLALANALSKTGKDLSPEAPEVSRIAKGLQDFLHNKQQPLEAGLANYHLAPQAERFTTRLKSVVTPIRVDDLSRYGKELRPWLEANLGLTAQEAEAVWLATHKFRATDFKEVGLYGLESKLRSTNVLEWGLKTLTGSKYAEGWKGKVGGVGTAAVAGATFGAVQTMDQEGLSFEDRLKAAATGAVVGVAGGAALRAGTNVLDQAARLLPKHKTLVDRAANWQYGYIADHLAQWRDSLRFTLSPFFDLSRYTEGLFLAQTAAPLRKADGTREVLPLNMSPHGLRKRLRNEGMTAPEAQAKYQGWLQEFQDFARSRGDFDAEVLDSTGRWFKQVGILGFSPTDWMGTAYASMVKAGRSKEEAYEAARQMYTYGTRGRSAAEMSANFIFFPFSFQKKALGHMAKWMNDDLARSIMIHDAMATYQALDERYNLDERWRDHIPFLQQLQRLNLFAYGLSPGRFGGMNSQLFESTGKLAWNLFVPAGLEIKDASAMDELIGTEEQRKNGRVGGVMGNLMPLVNDINWMVKNTKETGHVLFSESHVTTGAEIGRGYSEWYDFKTGFEAELRRKGYVLTDIFNKPWLQEAKDMYEAKRAELADKYPTWQQHKVESAYEFAALDAERRLRLDRVQLARLEGRAPAPDDMMLAQFDEVIAQYRQQLQLLTGSSDLTDAPPQVFQELLQMAVQFARQNPGFGPIYERFYESELGPLTVALKLTA